MSDQEFDDQLRKAAEQYQAPPFSQKAWKRMQQQLDDADKGNKTVNGKIILGVVLLLVLSAIYWFVAHHLRQEGTTVSHVVIQSTKEETLAIDEKHERAQINARNNNQQITTSDKEKIAPIAREGNTRSKLSQQDFKPSHSNQQFSQTFKTEQKASAQYNDALSKIQVSKLANIPPARSVLLPDDIRDISITNHSTEVIISKKEQKVLKPGSLRISLMLSPDFSSISLSTLFNRTGSMGSLGIEFFVFPRLSINTGLNLSSKVYSVHEYARYPSTYQQIPGLTGIDGKCKVIDLPLNVRYYAVLNGSHKFYIGTGISSYLMLSERYAFKYAPPEPDYVIGAKNENQHLLDIVNISLGYERVLGRRWAMQIEPFAKIPLHEIGAANLRLTTGGISLHLVYHLNYNHTAYR